MPRRADERTEQAKEMYLKGAKLVEIAARLNLPEGTIRSWKNRQKWECNVANTECNVANKKGGQPGNRNAVGNSGGAAPLGNKNAIRTGEFETLFFDTLEEDEKILADLIQPDKQQLLLQEIRLLTVRERRMLKRIEAIRQSVEYMKDGSPTDSFTAVSRKTGVEKGEPTDLTEYRGKLGQMQAIEEALTRVQARKQHAIDALHRYGTDNAKLEIERKKLRLLASEVSSKESIEDEAALTRVDIYLPEKELDDN